MLNATVDIPTEALDSLKTQIQQELAALASCAVDALPTFAWDSAEDVLNGFQRGVRAIYNDVTTERLNMLDELFPLLVCRELLKSALLR